MMADEMPGAAQDTGIHEAGNWEVWHLYQLVCHTLMSQEKPYAVVPWTTVGVGGFIYPPLVLSLSKNK